MRGARRRLGIQHRRCRRHFHALGHRADFQVDVDSGDFRGFQDQAGLGVLLKPGAVAVTLYSPGRRNGMAYAPDPSVVAVVDSLLLAFVRGTFAPGTAAPLASVT